MVVAEIDARPVARGARGRARALPAPRRAASRGRWSPGCRRARRGARSPATRSCTDSPACAKNGVPNPPAVKRRPIRPFAAILAGASSRSATVCQARRVRASRAPSATGASARQAPSQWSAHQGAMRLVGLRQLVPCDVAVRHRAHDVRAVDRRVDRVVGVPGCVGHRGRRRLEHTHTEPAADERRPRRRAGRRRASCVGSGRHRTNAYDLHAAWRRDARDASIRFVPDTWITPEMAGADRRRAREPDVAPDRRVRHPPLGAWPIYFPDAAAAALLGRRVRGDDPLRWSRRARGVQPVRVDHRIAARPSAPRRSTSGGAAPSVEESVDVEPPDTHFMLNGGLEVTYGVRMRPGDVITSVSRHAGYSERAGTAGPDAVHVQRDRVDEPARRVGQDHPRHRHPVLIRGAHGRRRSQSGPRSPCSSARPGCTRGTATRR